MVLVTETGVVENRIIETPPGLPPSALVEASNFLSARLVGRTLIEARAEILAELEAHRAELGQLTSKLVESGLAIWAGGEPGGSLIVRGQAHHAGGRAGDRRAGAYPLAVCGALETKETLVRLLSIVDKAEGVQIFIGSGDALFNVAGCSMIVSPYRDGRERIIGAIGVIGPTRINYARIIPMVDYTAKLVGRLIG